MSLSSQKSMQAYLDRHDIGKLFEDMMARLIKEMPNEPIGYLIKLLQRVSQRRSGSGENTYPSSILYKSGMGLTGSPMPLRQSKDPQIILPGSKQVNSMWMAEPSGKEEPVNNEVRSYEKPWLAGSKQLKVVKEKKDLSKTDPTSWIKEIKPSKLNDDLPDQKCIETKKSIVSKSVSIPNKENARRKKLNERSWSADLPIDEKENSAPQSRSVGSRCNSDKKSTLDDELKVVSRPSLGKNKKTICSPQTYSKFKRKLSKKKSFENKQKLQALLLTDQSKARNDDLDDSTDYEGDEVFEDTKELQIEGARSKGSSGLKHSYKCSNENIKVTVCSRCAQIMGDNNLIKPSVVSESLHMLSSDNEDFSSVSQQDPVKMYKPVWSPESKSEFEDKINAGDKLKSKNPPLKGILQTNKLNKNRMIEEEKSDFFEKNNPLKSKSKRFAGDFLSDESDGNEEGTQVILPRSKAWQQQLNDSGSEADVDEEPQIIEMKGRGWKQKVAKSNVTVTDI